MDGTAGSVGQWERNMRISTGLMNTAYRQEMSPMELDPD